MKAQQANLPNKDLNPLLSNLPMKPLQFLLVVYLKVGQWNNGVGMGINGSNAMVSNNQ
jgi:hypothetical protein